MTRIGLVTRELFEPSLKPIQRGNSTEFDHQGHVILVWQHCFTIATLPRHSPLYLECSSPHSTPPDQRSTQEWLNTWPQWGATGVQSYVSGHRGSVHGFVCWNDGERLVVCSRAASMIRQLSLPPRCANVFSSFMHRLPLIDGRARTTPYITGLGISPTPLKTRCKAGSNACRRSKGLYLYIPIIKYGTIDRSLYTTKGTEASVAEACTSWLIARLEGPKSMMQPLPLGKIWGNFSGRKIISFNDSITSSCLQTFKRINDTQWHRPSGRLAERLRTMEDCIQRELDPPVPFHASSATPALSWDLPSSTRFE